MSEQKTQIPGLFRAPSGALINKDYKALEAYKKRKASAVKIDHIAERLDILEQKIESLIRVITINGNNS